MELRETTEYVKWFSALRDTKAKARINARLRIIATIGAITGDVKNVGDQVLELRFHFGPGCRVYLARQGDYLALLLAGGDKSSQSRDIAVAKRLAREWNDEH